MAYPPVRNPMAFPPDYEPRLLASPYVTRVLFLPDRTRTATFPNATVLLLFSVAWEAHRGTAGMAYPPVRNPMAFPPDYEPRLSSLPDSPYVTQVLFLPDRTRTATFPNTTVLLLFSVWMAYPRVKYPRVFPPDRTFPMPYLTCLTLLRRCRR